MINTFLTVGYLIMALYVFTRIPAAVAWGISKSCSQRRPDLTDWLTGIVFGLLVGIVWPGYFVFRFVVFAGRSLSPSNLSLVAKLFPNEFKPVETLGQRRERRAAEAKDEILRINARKAELT